MSTIELGEIPRDPGDRPEPPGSAGLDRRLVRQAGCAAVAVLCAVALAGSAVPRLPGVRLLWSVSVAQSQGIALTAGGVFVRRNIGPASTVTAYDLATGKVRWQRGFARSIGYLETAEPAGLLLVPADGDIAPVEPGGSEEFGREFHRRTIAVSAATGEEVWRTAGEPQSVTGDTALMTEYTERGTIVRMRVIRLADGGTVWAHRTPGVQTPAVAMAGARPDKVVTVTATGDVRIYSYASGTLVSAARIPWVTPRPEEGFFNDLSVTGDHLVVNRAQAEIFDMSVYRMDTMAEVWRAHDTNGYAFACGPALCLNDGRGLVARDVATGAARWQQTGVASAWEVGEGRLLVSDGAEEGRQVLLDAVNGVPVAEASGSAVWGAGDHQPSILLLRSAVSPADRTAVTSWDVATGRQHLLGSIDRLLGTRCQALPGYLTCMRGDAFEVTAVPRVSAG